jgi:hypothetical protein
MNVELWQASALVPQRQEMLDALLLLELQVRQLVEVLEL